MSLRFDRALEAGITMRILWALIVICLVAPLAVRAQEAETPRIEGTYSTDMIPFKTPVRTVEGAMIAGIYQHLMFYPDGTVIGTSSSATYDEIRHWFHRGNPDVTAGTYRADAGRICFGLTAARPASEDETRKDPPKSVDYCGEFQGSDFRADVHSNINGHRSEQIFHAVE